MQQSEEKWYAPNQNWTQIIYKNMSQWPLPCPQVNNFQVVKTCHNIRFHSKSWPYHPVMTFLEQGSEQVHAQVIPFPLFFVTCVNYWYNVALFFSDCMLRQNNTAMWHTIVWYKLIMGREKFATLNFMVEKNPEEGCNKFLRIVLKFLPDWVVTWLDYIYFEH
jgi:hypothetical protein